MSANGGMSKARGRGFSVLEVIVSMILLGAVLAVIVPFAKRVNERQRATEARRAALLEVSNTLERITADPGTGPAAGEEKEAPLPEALARRFEEPRLVVRGTALEGPPGRRFDAAMTWKEATGGRSAPVRLSAFVYDAGGTP